MSCKFDKDIIHKYIDNTIDPLELIFLKEHIKVCEDCRNDLELMSKLDDSLYGYFEGSLQCGIPEDFSLSALDRCYEEKKPGLMDRVKRTVEINKRIYDNATRFTKHLPGSKTTAKAVKIAGQGLNRAVKGCLNYGVKKLYKSFESF